MHSRIFEIVKVDNEEYLDNFKTNLTEDNVLDYCEHRQFFDYVHSDTDFNDDVIWFKNCYGKVFDISDDNVFTIDDDTARAYFKGKFEKYKEIAEVMTLDDFALGFSQNRWESQNLLEENDGFHIMISSDYGWIDTLDNIDSIVRYSRGIYKIVNSMDYHW